MNIRQTCIHKLLSKDQEHEVREKHQDQHCDIKNHDQVFLKTKSQI